MAFSKGSITYEYDTREVEQMLDRTADFVGSRVRHTLRGEVRNNLRERVARRFDMQGDSASGPWRPLADSTIRRKGSTWINIEEGDMRTWAEQADVRVTGGAGDFTLRWPGEVPHEDRMWFKVGNAQFGGRDIFAVDDTDIEQALTAIQHDFEQFLGGSLP